MVAVIAGSGGPGGGRWEDGKVQGVTETSLKNANFVSSDEVKTVCRKIDTNKNQPFKQRTNRIFVIPHTN